MSYQAKTEKTYRHRLLKNPKKQEGIAIVIALFIVALVATMAYVMMERLARDTRQTTLILRDTQAELYAQGSIAWAMDQLSKDWIRQKNNQLIDATPIKSPVDVKQGYKISTTIYDMQARFNLNRLVTPAALPDFERLLRAVKPDLTNEQAREIAQSVAYWLSLQAPDSARNQYYADLPVPYRVASRLMESVSELRLVKGMTPALFNALRPYITALPTNTPINVQTADLPVLMSLSPEMTLATAKAIVAIRAKNPFVTKQAFTNSDIVRNRNIKDIDDKITHVSSYFLVETEVRMDEQHLVIFTLLERTMSGTNPVVTILWQAKGTW